MSLHPRTWIIWVIAAATAAMLARNPLYSLIILAASQLVVLAHGRTDQAMPMLSWRVAALVLLFSALYNGLFVHAGETVLFALPDWPLIGGPITAEAMADGLRNGLLLLALLSVFAALNAILPVADLVRLIPAALQDLGVVILIAITYVPETRRHLARIKDAQAIRGHELKGLRDWRPVVIPLLIGGLERAMQLAEAMVARGYGATATIEQGRLERLGLLVALLVALLGWLVSFWSGWAGLAMLAVGGLMVIALLAGSGSRNGRTRYRAVAWRRADSLAVGAAVLALAVVVLPLPIVDRSTMLYSSYPHLAVPPYDWLIGFGLAGLGLPAIVTS